ncbi:hypothetical protein MNBD_GAMMA10-3287 [hydrothermal vent metagenome]|uniref:DUF1778 domain-containing protein n=1 Tax=hydrothermal vent metagenome TaxID=652676 RepID=A0A3B0XEX4_9ZZZZ
MAEQATRRERIDMRVEHSVKQLAERASAARGASLTEYISALIREDAPKILESEASIRLTDAQFDHFIAVCNDTEQKPSKRILDAAKRLDAEGY